MPCVVAVFSGEYASTGLTAQTQPVTHPGPAELLCLYGSTGVLIDGIFPHRKITGQISNLLVAETNRPTWAVLPRAVPSIDKEREA